jgi:hypothetical protein
LLGECGFAIDRQMLERAPLTGRME